MNYDRLGSVRKIFQHDLVQIGNFGTVFLPEWICYDLTKSVEEIGWSVCWYPVTNPEASTCPLGLDSLALLNSIHQHNQTSRPRPAAILFAHPLGYVDTRIRETMSQLRDQDQTYLFLDLAQSYGIHDFRDEISKVRAAYISFNGNKLLRCGGSLKIEPQDLPTQDYLTWQQRFERIANENFQKYAFEFQKNLDQFSPLCKQIIYNALQPLNRSIPRSNPHRTALWFETVEQEILTKWTTNGWGQPLHPHPQFGRIDQSANYRKWEEKMYLLFPERRKETYATSH